MDKMETRYLSISTSRVLGDSSSDCLDFPKISLLNRYFKSIAYDWTVTISDDWKPIANCFVRGLAMSILLFHQLSALCCAARNRFVCRRKQHRYVAIDKKKLNFTSLKDTEEAIRAIIASTQPPTDEVLCNFFGRINLGTVLLPRVLFVQLAVYDHMIELNCSNCK